MIVNTSVAQNKDYIKLVSLSNLNFDKDNTFFDEIDYSLKLKKQLKNYHMGGWSKRDKRGFICFTPLSLNKPYFER